MELHEVKPREIKKIADKINNRPRKKLNFKTPANILINTFEQKLALGVESTTFFYSF